MTAPTLEGLRDLAWSRLEAGLSDASAPSRHATLATIGPHGPEARTLVLRAVDRAGGTLDLHADAASAKVGEIEADPRATVHLWDPGASLQLRLRGRVEIVAGAEADALWDRVPDGARLNYGGAPMPGTPIPEPAAYEPGASRRRFAVLRFHVRRIDALLLREPHLRAVFEPQNVAKWVAP